MATVGVDAICWMDPATHPALRHRGETGASFAIGIAWESGCECTTSREADWPVVTKAVIGQGTFDRAGGFNHSR